MRKITWNFTDSIFVKEVEDEDHEKLAAFMNESPWTQSNSVQLIYGARDHAQHYPAHLQKPLRDKERL